MDKRKNKRTTKIVEEPSAEELEPDTRELVDVGLDISTAIVGLVALNASSGQLVEMDAIKLTGKNYDSVWDKAAKVEQELLRLIDPTKYKVNNILVEEAHMKFTAGFSSAGTLFSLARFNGIVSFIAFKLFDVQPKMINVRTARKFLGIKINYKDKSKDTKTKIFEFVKNQNPNFPWSQHMAKGGKHKGKLVWSKHNFDMADAWVICEGGRRTLKPEKK